MEFKWFSVWTLLTVFLYKAKAQCPWSNNYTELISDCICSYNTRQELSIQCSSVPFPRLLDALYTTITDQTIYLLYVNNSSIVTLNRAVFRNLKITNVQLSDCGLTSINPQAFQGQEETLKNLNLQNNKLKSVPVLALRNLRRLSLLDLSRNQIRQITRNAFITLKLGTLKIGNNPNLTVNPSAFRGLEGSLKNLNLAGVGLGDIPRAMRNLSALAFLDVAQNDIRHLERKDLQELHSLTALNLERNALQTLEDDVFVGVNDTMSSLSLLNNHLREFPTKPLSALTQLRVSSTDIKIKIYRTSHRRVVVNSPLLILIGR